MQKENRRKAKQSRNLEVKKKHTHQTYVPCIHDKKKEKRYSFTMLVHGKQKTAAVNMHMLPCKYCFDVVFFTLLAVFLVYFIVCSIDSIQTGTISVVFSFLSFTFCCYCSLLVERVQFFITFSVVY